MAGGELIAMAPFERGLERKSEDREEREERGNGEGGDKVVVIVESLNLKRHGVGLAANMTRNDADGSKLSHRARVAQEDAVKKAEANVGQRDAPESLPAGRAER